MSTKKLRYNPTTLLFEQDDTSIGKKIANLAIRFVLSLIVAVIVYNSYTYFFDTPKQKTLLREYADITLKVDLLGRRLAETDKILDDIQRRDNYTYRAIFEIDTIPASLRMGGIGGSSRYEDLKRFQNASLVIDIATKLDQVMWKTYIQSKSFDQVIPLAKNKEQMVMCIPAIQPLSGKDFERISSPFGYRADPFTRKRSLHYGIDISGPLGSPIHSSGKGTVIEVQHSFLGYGNMVTIDHGFGYKSRYAHLQSIKVKMGDEVLRGQIVGTLGNTGRSTGPHLHYEVFYNNVKINPINFLGELPPDLYEMMVKNVGGGN